MGLEYNIDESEVKKTEEPEVKKTKKTEVKEPKPKKTLQEQLDDLENQQKDIIKKKRELKKHMADAIEIENLKKQIVGLEQQVVDLTNQISVTAEQKKRYQELENLYAYICQKQINIGGALSNYLIEYYRNDNNTML